MVIILVPVFNEEESIGGVLNDIQAIFTNLNLKYKILVVDDGSNDNSGWVVKSLQDKIPIDLIEFSHNSGIGQVLRVGFNRACSLAEDKDIIVFLEGDGSMNVSILPEMLNEVNNGKAIVIASRYCKGGQIKGFPLKRRFLSRSLNFLLKLSFPLAGLTDYTIFFRAYRAQIMKKGLGRYGDSFIQSKGFAANTEVLLKLMTFKPKIGEVPLVFNYYLKKSTSKLNIWKEISGHLVLIAKRIFNE